MNFRFGAFAQLITSFVLAGFFTVAAAVVGIVSIQQFHEGIEEVALSRMPAMTLAYQLGQQSEAIVASAPMLVRVETQEQRKAIMLRISDRVRWLHELVGSLQNFNINENVLEVIDLTRKQLLENYARLDLLVKERIFIVEHGIKRKRELQDIFRQQEEIDGKEHKRWSLAFYQMIELLLILETENDASHLKIYEDKLLGKFAEINALKPRTLTSSEEGLFNRIQKVALGEKGLIAVQMQQRAILLRISGILAVNERLSKRFVYSVNDLIRRMRKDIENQSTEFETLVKTRTNMLSFLVLASVFGMSLIGLVVIRRILKRLNALKRSMRIHAQGGQAEIQLEGEDEISDMAKALKYLVDEIEHREREARLSEARFRDVAEATSDWFWETDAQLSFSLLSDRFFDISGFTRDQSLKGLLLNIEQGSGTEVDDPEKWIQHCEDLKNRRRFRDFAYSVKCPDGVWRQFKISGKPIFETDGRFMGYRGTGSDITAETQARSRLMAANEIMPGAFALWDHENRLILCNRKYYQYYETLSDRIRPGVTFEELVSLLKERGAIRDEFDYVERRREFRHKPTGTFMEALSDGRYLQVSEAPTLDGGTVSLVIDITDRMESETRLEQARFESESANKAKSKFLAAASHDLRQPLHAIGMFLSALEDRRRKDETDVAKGDLRIIENISDSLEALRGLLNALLDISKLDAGVMKVELEPVMLRPLVKRLLKQYEVRAQEKGLRLRYKCPNVAVRSDPVLLERIVSNLLSNAVRYTSQGGVLLGARLRGDQVLLQVYDTGLGIPKNKVKDIFVEFQQLDNAARDRRRGLGLGLAIVERVLALLKHPLDLRSVVAKGSVFSLTLPRDELIKEVADDKPVEVALMGADVPLIVVIDDEPDILEGMEQLIRGWKYDVIAASSTQEALAQLDKIDVRPSLILADYRLQEDITGADAIRLIQEKLNFPIAAAIITGDTAPERIQDAKASGFVLLHKPLRPAKLRQLIRSVQVQSL